jgi:hypothetical protein
VYDEKRIIQTLIEKDPLQSEYDNLVLLARKNYCDGIIVEPRGMFITGEVDANGNLSVFPDTFMNGEDFPIRITHVTAAPAFLTTASAAQNPLTLQRIGMRLMRHDQWYMNMDEPLTRIPLWINKNTANIDITSRAQSSWRFDVPFILSAKDSMSVQVSLVQAPTPPGRRSIVVAFTGVGLLSKRPYFWAGTRDGVTDTSQGVVSSVFFVNDGTEPVAITDMTCHVSSDNTANDATGNIYLGDVQISQIGNGTQANWFSSLDPTADPRCPMALLGLTTGRAAVHRLPGDGFLMEPGAVVSLALQQVDSTTAGYRVGVGLFGYITVS